MESVFLQSTARTCRKDRTASTRVTAAHPGPVGVSAVTLMRRTRPFRVTRLPCNYISGAAMGPLLSPFRKDRARWRGDSAVRFLQKRPDGPLQRPSKRKLMTRLNTRLLALLLLTSVVATTGAACGSATPVTTTAPTPVSTTETFSGSFAQLGSVTHSFTV
jgi:hypothetical protein